MYLNTTTLEGFKYKYFLKQMYLNTNTLESMSNTFSNTFHFQDILLCLQVKEKQLILY